MAQSLGVWVVLLAIILATSAETFQLPDFVVIERNEIPVCGGWVIDKTFRRYVLATERCVQASSDVRELLVRHGGAQLTWRSLSSGVNRKLYHPSHARLVVLSTYGKFRRLPATFEPQHHNGTVVLGWSKRHALIEKTVLVVAEDQERNLPQLARDLLCRSPPGSLVLEGALILHNLKPFGMLSIRGKDSCETSEVEVLELGDLTSEWRVSALRERKDLESPEQESTGWFSEANSPFGYIMYTIFMGYTMVYIMLYFILAIGKPPSSTDL